MADRVLNDLRLLECIHEAGVDLVDSCAVVLEAALLAPQEQEEQAEERSAMLAGAIMRLRQLLRQVPMQLHPVAARQAAAGRASGTAHLGPCANLLHLPDDLLHRVVRLAGKGCRGVCSHLRDAYGCPDTALTQPAPGFGVQLATEQLSEGYMHCHDTIKARIVDGALRNHGAQLVEAAVQSCAARWPGWAALVTRLELSDTCTPDADALHLISQALPGLRRLTLAEAPSRMPSTWHLPQFLQVTHLGMLCHTRTLVENFGPAAVAFRLLGIAPHVHSLHLDLRFQRLQCLQPMLGSLVHLTHLELVFEPDEERLAESDKAEVRGALQSLADRLQSLVFLTPTEAVEPGLSTALQSLTRLTSLGWCMQWAAGYGSLDESSSFLLLPSLRQLVVGTASRNYYGTQVDADDAGGLANAMARGGEVMPGLEALVLPVVALARKADVVPGVTEGLHQLLGVVADRCPGLTSLQTGFVFENIVADLSRDFTLPERGPWLPPVARLQQLQRLVLTMNADDVDALACLGLLPLLRELWLWLKNEFLLTRRVATDPVFRPGAVLGLLKALQHLSLRTSWEAEDCPQLVHWLLHAASTLPKLQVLDLSAAAELATYRMPLLRLAASPPPNLCEVRLPSTCGTGDFTYTTHQHTRALLQARLPTFIAVTVGADMFEEDEHWGPQPRTPAEMSAQHAPQAG